MSGQGSRDERGVLHRIMIQDIERRKMFWGFWSDFTRFYWEVKSPGKWVEAVTRENGHRLTQ